MTRHVHPVGRQVLSCNRMARHNKLEAIRHEKGKLAAIFQTLQYKILNFAAKMFAVLKIVANFALAIEKQRLQTSTKWCVSSAG